MHARDNAARPPSRSSRAVGQDLVGVHIVRGAGAGLVDVDHELVAMLAVEDLVGRRDDGVGDVAVKTTECSVRLVPRLS